jgi:hypothetical protein
MSLDRNREGWGRTLCSSLNMVVGFPVGPEGTVGTYEYIREGMGRRPCILPCLKGLSHELYWALDDKMDRYRPGEALRLVFFLKNLYTDTVPYLA